MRVHIHCIRNVCLWHERVTGLTDWCLSLSLEQFSEQDCNRTQVPCTS